MEDKLKGIAPNLCATVGRTCSAKLIAAAGGLEELSRMPACNIQVMGGKGKSLIGMSKQGKNLHHGFFGDLDLVKNCPEDFKTRLVRMLSNK